jgi:carboxyl-terminal processing protease
MGGMRRWSWLCAIAFTCNFAMAQQLPAASSSQAAISTGARDYLEAALDTMRQHALFPDQVDWKALRQQSFIRAAGASTAADTYPAIIYACETLRQQQQCGGFRLPDSASPATIRKAQEAEAANAPPERKAILALPPSPFTSRGDPVGRFLKSNAGKTFAYLVVPHCYPPFADMAKDKPFLDHWAATLRALVLNAASAHPSGWIVDLRGNGGSNMWAALAGLGPLLGDGPVGFFKDRKGRQEWLYDKDGIAVMSLDENGEPREVYIQRLGGPQLALGDAPVAVLLDNATGGSGEAIAIAFAGRHRERSFGVHTAGATGCCARFPLSDGAVLALNFGVEQDRRGHGYPEGLQPDVLVELNPAAIADPDAVIQAAEDWLSSLH